jgi:hypothetical protein
VKMVEAQHPGVGLFAVRCKGNFLSHPRETGALVRGQQVCVAEIVSGGGAACSPSSF